MKFRKTNSTLTNLERGTDISLYDVIGLFQDICDDLEEENDMLLDELELGDADKAVGRLLWVGQEITSVLRSHKKALVDPGRLAKIQKQEEKLSYETELLAGAEADLMQFTQREKQLLQVQEKRKHVDQQKVKLFERCEQLEKENSFSESVTLPELEEKKRRLEEKQKGLIHAKRECEEECIRLKIANEEELVQYDKAKSAYVEASTVYEDLRVKVQDLEKKQSDCLKNNQEIREQADEIEKELKRLESDNFQLKSVIIPELQERSEELAQRKEELENECEVGQREKELRRERVETLKKSVEELLGQNKELAQVIREMKEKVDGFELLKKERQTDIDLLEAQLKKQEEQLGDLTTEKNSLIRKITELTGNIEEHNIHNLRKRYKEYQAEYQELEKQLQQLEDQYDEMTRAREVKAFKKEQLEQEILDLGNQLQEQGEELLKLDNEKDKLVAQIEEKENHRQELEAWFTGLEYKGCEERLEKVQRRIGMLREVQKSLIKDLDDRLYLSSASATEQMRKVSEDYAKRLEETEKKAKALQAEYATIVKIIGEKGE